MPALWCTSRPILYLRSRLNEIYKEHTGQTLEAIEQKLERDTYLSAVEAQAFGIVDEVLQNRPVPASEDASKA